MNWIFIIANQYSYHLKFIVLKSVVSDVNITMHLSDIYFSFTFKLAIFLCIKSISCKTHTHTHICMYTHTQSENLCFVNWQVSPLIFIMINFRASQGINLFFLVSYSVMPLLDFPCWKIMVEVLANTTVIMILEYMRIKSTCVHLKLIQCCMSIISQ